MMRIEATSLGALLLFLGAWLLIVLFGVSRSVLLRDR
jgi:hypothetical protein